MSEVFENRLSLRARDEKEVRKLVGTTKRRSRRSHLLEETKRLRSLNPFQTNDAMEWEELALFAVGAVILLPVRMMFIAFSVGIATIGMLISVAGVADLNEPLAKWRLDMQGLVLRLLGRVMLFAVFGVYDLKVKGKVARPEEAKMLIFAPHSTLMDAFLIAATTNGPSGVGKAEVRETILGPSFMAAQFLLVDRDDSSSREYVSSELKARLQSSKWKRQMVIAPEGTCTNRTALIQFKKGAFEAAEPIQPVLLRFEFTGFDPSWTAGSPSRTKVAFRSLTQFQQSASVEFLPVYVPSEEEKQDPSFFAENVRELMAQKLNIGVTEFSNLDMFLAKIAAKRGLMPALTLPFSFVDLKQEVEALGFEKHELFDLTKALLMRFAKGAGKNSRLSRGDFEKIKEAAANDIGLSETLDWDAFFTDDDTDFHVFLLEHLKSLSKKKQA